MYWKVKVYLWNWVIKTTLYLNISYHWLIIFSPSTTLFWFSWCSKFADFTFFLLFLQNLDFHFHLVGRAHILIFICAPLGFQYSQRSKLFSKNAKQIIFRLFSAQILQSCSLFLRSTRLCTYHFTGGGRLPAFQLKPERWASYRQQSQRQDMVSSSIFIW